MVRYLTTNGKSNTYGGYKAFALMYRRVNATFYEFIKVECKVKMNDGIQRSWCYKIESFLRFKPMIISLKV
jgi:hypothetical protein